MHSFSRSTILTFFATLALGFGLVWMSEQQALDNARNDLQHKTEIYTAAIQRNLERALSAAYPVAALVQHHNGSPPGFEALAAKLLPMYQGLSALGLAPDGVMSTMVPLAGNENAIGHDLLNDRGRAKEAWHTRDTGLMTLAGPFDLVQGGIGAVGRLPVYLGGRNDVESGRFWGFVSAVIRFPDVLVGTSLAELAVDSYDFELWRTHPNTGERHVIATLGNLKHTAVDVRFNVPNGEWVLSVAPSAGWFNAERVALKSGLACVFSLLCSLLALQMKLLRQEKASLQANVAAAVATVRASEERLTYVMAATGEGIWDWSIPEDRVGHNERWGHVFGLQEVPLSHPVSFFVEHIHPDDREAVMTRVRQALDTDCDYDSEHRLICLDGRIIWVHDRGRVVVRDTAENPLRMVGSLRDITQRKQSELDLIEAKRAAEAANIAKSRFLATMSHEIRTPMNGILGMAQVLLMPGVNETQRCDYARTILNSGQSLLNLLNDILDYSKVEAGKLELAPVAFYPDQLVHEMLALFGDGARSKGLQLQAIWHGEEIAYLADAHRLRQMIANLIGNALKFTARGEVCIEVREIERDGKTAVLEFAVRDTGIGIPSDKLALLFKPFSQADNSITRQFGGTGLGLSIVKQLTQLMDGEVGVESEVGQGSRFWFRIRAAVDTRSERRRQERQGPAIPFSVQMPLRGKLLVVEDDATNQKVIRAMLDTLGISAELAGNGQQAIERIERGESFDLILMDVQMPVMDGITATAQIRQRERELGESRRTIIALTADAYAADRERCLAAGMDDFLTKPIDVVVLTRLLGQWLPSSTEQPSAPMAAPVAASTGTTAEGAVLPASTFSEVALLEPLGGNRELARLVVESAMSDLPKYLAQLEQFCQADDWQAAERPAHTMKGLAAQIGGLALARRMREADAQLKRGVLLDADTLVQLQAEYAALAAALQQWLESPA